MKQINIVGVLSGSLLLIMFIFLWIENGLISPFLYFIGFFLGALLFLNQEKKNNFILLFCILFILGNYSDFNFG